MSRRAAGLAIGVAVAAFGGLPAEAAAGSEVRILSDVLLVQPETFEGGSILGPPDSRATWYSFGGIVPFSGQAMLVFSTGQVGGDPLPGTDLSAVGPGDDIAGLNLSLRVPEDAHSMRIAARLCAPAAAELPELVDDVARILVQGDPIALDPYSLGDLTPPSPALTTARDSELQGTPFARPDGGGTAWIEAIVAVQPGSQIAVTIEVRDGGASAGGDVVLLVDGLRFDAGVPEAAEPGPAPLLTAVTPDEAPEDRPVTVVLEGRSFPPDLAVELTADDETLVVVPDADVTWRSAERVEVELPALPEADAGVRLTWSGGAVRWDDVLTVDTPRPRILSVTPNTGPAAGGGLATLSGSGFFDVSSVSVGGSPATNLVVVSRERIDFVVPPGEPGPADVELFAAGGFVEAPGAWTWAEATDGAGDDDDDGGSGPSPVECSVAGGGSSFALALVLLGVRRRARRDGPGRASG